MATRTLYMPDWVWRTKLIDEEWNVHPARYKSIRGGRDSSKTTTVARIFVALALKRRCKILCLREYKANQDSSVKAALRRAIGDFGLDSMFKVGVGRITCPSTESLFSL